MIYYSKPNETAFQIAQKYLGSGMHARELVGYSGDPHRPLPPKTALTMQLGPPKQPMIGRQRQRG